MLVRTGSSTYESCLILVACLFLLQSYEQDELRKKTFQHQKRYRDRKYDPVGYFNGKPEEGDEELKTSYRGITYRFASPANLARFNTVPDTYEPAYGGWCADAMGE